MKKVTLENYKKDKYYPKVVVAVDTILNDHSIVRTIDVFVSVGMLEKKKMEAWKAGHIPYLEKVLNGSLSKLNRVLRILRFHVHDLNLRPQKHIVRNEKNILRYSKTGDPKLEDAYSLEYAIVSKKQRGSVSVAANAS